MRGAMQFRMLRGVVALIAMAVVAMPAAAGCLKEYDTCSACGQAMMWKGVRTLDPSAIVEANLYLADCSIDLWHCLLFDNHHGSPCPV